MAEDEPEEDQQGDSQVPLERRDYLALTIAALETIFLPLVVVIVILVVLLFVIK